jgi:hypothetical protein
LAQTQQPSKANKQRSMTQAPKSSNETGDQKTPGFGRQVGAALRITIAVAFIISGIVNARNVSTATRRWTEGTEGDLRIDSKMAEAVTVLYDEDKHTEAINLTAKIIQLQKIVDMQHEQLEKYSSLRGQAIFDKPTDGLSENQGNAERLLDVDAKVGEPNLTANKSTQVTELPDPSKFDVPDLNGESFSACLLIMDENIRFGEWLVYHYYTMPLRNLVLAVDPRSKTSPEEILAKWRPFMNITIWGDDEILEGKWLERSKKMTNRTANSASTDDLTGIHIELTKIHRVRQPTFSENAPSTYSNRIEPGPHSMMSMNTWHLITTHWAKRIAPES